MPDHELWRLDVLNHAVCSALYLAQEVHNVGKAVDLLSMVGRNRVMLVVQGLPRGHLSGVRLALDRRRHVEAEVVEVLLADGVVLLLRWQRRMVHAHLDELLLRHLDRLFLGVFERSKLLLRSLLDSVLVVLLDSALQVWLLLFRLDSGLTLLAPIGDGLLHLIDIFKLLQELLVVEVLVDVVGLRWVRLDHLLAAARWQWLVIRRYHLHQLALAVPHRHPIFRLLGRVLGLSRPIAGVRRPGLSDTVGQLEVLDVDVDDLHDVVRDAMRGALVADGPP